MSVSNLEDPYVDATVVCFTKRYRESGPDYDYAALKANGLWYLTSGDRLSWEHLLEEVARDNLYDSKLYVATDFDEVEVDEA